eukprot:9380539-Pyramimonas_sp.AAC.1
MRLRCRATRRRWRTGPCVRGSASSPRTRPTCSAWPSSVASTWRCPLPADWPGSRGSLVS